MMRPVPGDTKIKIEIFRGVRVWDLLVGFLSALLIIFVVVSSHITAPLKIVLSLFLISATAFLIARISDNEPNYQHIARMLRYLVLPKRFERVYSDDMLYEKKLGVFKDEYLSDLSGSDGDEEDDKEDKKDEEGRSKKKEKKSHTKEKHYDFMENIVPFTGVSNGFILYDDLYMGSVIAVDPIEYRFMTEKERNEAIEQGFGSVLRILSENQAANIIKIDRPLLYDEYLEKEYDKQEQLLSLYEKAMMSEDELKSRMGIEYDRISELRSLCYEKKVLSSRYYIALFAKEETELSSVTERALEIMKEGGLEVRKLDTKELIVFLKYTNHTDFEERDIDEFDIEDQYLFAMPEKIDIHPHHIRINGVCSYNYRIMGYPVNVDNAWMEKVMSIPSTKVVVKCSPVEREKAIRDIDRSLEELRGRLTGDMSDSVYIKLTADVQSLEELLEHIREENESLLEINIYVTAYDITRISAENAPSIAEGSILPEYEAMTETIKRLFSEEGFKLDPMDYRQIDAFVGAQISAYDPIKAHARALPSNTIAAMFPWIHPIVSDPGGIKLGLQDKTPVFVDFFKRDETRVNSNLVVIGKSGSGKSFATKHLLANLAGDDCKIFILDPENEYSVLAGNLNGKVINVGNASAGRINPFHIMTDLDDDEGDSRGAANSFSTHLQFLEEFFKQILPECDADALEYLNTLLERVYSAKHIGAATNFSALSPEEYPIFDDLYDQVLFEFEKTNNDYLKSTLRTLINYISKFSTGGRNAGIWNGPSTITTDSNFTVFNFQSMLANRNSTISNAQMLLVLKYIDNEIIKNRDYNKRHGTKRKVVVAIDEAHVFIDSKYPVALDFMYQLAKRIRKYNGMQIVITQNIKDFVGNEEIAAKSTAIINACQYSMIFPLAPNDMSDLCTLYEKAGGINEKEQEEILGAPRGRAFAILSPGSRSTFQVEPDADTVTMFEKENYDNGYFTGVIGEEIWNDFISESKIMNAESKVREEIFAVEEEENRDKENTIHFSNISFSIDESGSSAADDTLIIDGQKVVFDNAKNNKGFESSNEGGLINFSIAGEETDTSESGLINFSIAGDEADSSDVSQTDYKEKPENDPGSDFDGERFMRTLLGERNYNAMIDSIRQRIIDDMSKGK
ncbi:MAG: DUF87 domain-containing protein [Lachnospiraceae bacterium]|nr:DUF87 domain-containing protein [Lachnospiraceae bacterium]